MEIKAKARYLRMSPRKVRLVIDMIRGKKVSEASDILNFSNKWAKRPIIKLLNSAIANAEHNFDLQKDNLYIKVIKADGGPMLKRWMPRAFGRAGAIRKRTCHIEIILDELKKDITEESTVIAKKDKKETEAKNQESKKNVSEKKDKKKKVLNS
ncbi:MAG: 50S ribosomal protein L22 [Parcubacteria group bacterium CG10_big_fil_rev_8_21_14_0_10_36_14]|nr:MAG: 50S ribosomal protein L22 [Parcubacteria group bacterium CG10_big_fil_rev_8_21_14_0_10_36_14]